MYARDWLQPIAGIFDSKKQRILETYLDGFISKKDRDIRLLKVEDDVRDHLDTISLLQGKRRAIMRLLDGAVYSQEISPCE